MAIELGAAYLSILPETSKLAPGIKKELGLVERGSVKTGGGMGSALATGMKRTLKASLAGGALFAGVASKKGLDRLMGIEDARASLAGLGYDAKTIEKIAGNALDSVKGTAFGLADAVKVAASSVAAGVKPGEDLTKNLKLVGDAATIAGTDLGTMGAIFGKVAASNKIQGDVIAQLNDAGIPIVQLMAKELGVTAEETVELASKGKVNFATFSKAMEGGLGGAALKSGDTLRGSVANLSASVGRIGANFLEGTYPKLAPAIQAVTDKFGGAEGGAKKAGERFGELVEDYVVPGIKKLVELRDIVAVMVGGFIAYAGATKAAAIGQAIYTAGTAGATAGTWSLNAALRANPIGIVVTALTALAAGLVYAYNRSETFRSIVDGAFTSIKAVALPVLNWLGTAVMWTIEKVKKHWRLIVSVIGGPIGLAIAHFGKIKSAIGKVREVFGVVVGGIGKAWGKLTGFISRPIDAAIGVVNAFIKALNKLPFVDLPLISTGSGKGSAKKGVVRENGKTSFAQGGWTGPGSRYTPAGVVHADEFVLSKPARRALERSQPGVLDFMNRTGEWPLDYGYAAGGRVRPVNGGSYGKGYRGHTGIDISGPGIYGRPVFAAHDGRIASTAKWGHSYGWHIRQSGAGGTSIYAHLSKIGVKAGQKVSAGQRIGAVGSTGNSSGPHLHFERRPPGTQAGSLAWLRGAKTASGAGSGLPFDSVAGMNGWLSGQASKAAAGSAGGWFSIPRMMQDIASSGRSWVKDKVFDSGGIASGRGVLPKNTLAPERVLSPSSTKALDQGLRNLSAPSDSKRLVRDELARVLERGVAIDMRGPSPRLNFNVGG